jgi:hypothetical protein
MTHPYLSIVALEASAEILSLRNATDRRAWLQMAIDEPNPPDWVVAAYNCKIENEVMAMAVSVFLDDCEVTS